MELKEIAIESILVGDRFREDLGDLAMLIESFKREGIIQPLAVRENSDGTYSLLAGGRRYTAATRANLATVPVRCYPATLSEIEMRSIELMENTCRKDLTWLESAKLKKEIHELQVAIHGPKISTLPGAPGHGQKETAELLGVTQGTVSQEIKLADMVEIFPELAKAKDKSEATKMMAKLQENFIREELASRIASKIAGNSTERIHQDLISRYILGDFFDGISQVPDRSIDFIELDPPYAIALNKQKRDMKDIHGEAYNEVDEKDYYTFMSTVARESFRVMSNDSWIVVWHGVEWGQCIFELFKEVGFKGDIHAAIWNKGNVGQTNTPNLHLASCYEPFFYFRKGNPSIIRQGRSNVFNYKPVFSGSKIHPTERPIEIIQDIIQTFCWEGSHILVPFLGSGNTILAAANLGMSAFGWELEEEYKNSYTVRVASSVPTKYCSYKEGAANAS